MADAWNPGANECATMRRVEGLVRGIRLLRQGMTLERRMEDVHYMKRLEARMWRAIDEELAKLDTQRADEKGGDNG